jgi:hypothetical protein
MRWVQPVVPPRKERKKEREVKKRKNSTMQGAGGGSHCNPSYLGGWDGEAEVSGQPGQKCL